MFTELQIELLKAPLNRSHVSERSNGGKMLSYIEGYHAIDTANEIFGFDGWASDMTLQLVTEYPVEIGGGYGKKGSPGTEVVYRAEVTVTVGNQSHKDVGTGNGRAKAPKDAHELAMKEAVTDALKRALRHWGNQFGNCLYDKTQKNVSDEAEEKPKKGKAKKAAPANDVEKLLSVLRECTDTEEVEKFRIEYRDEVNSSDSKAEIMEVYKEMKNKFRKELNEKD